MSTPDGTSATHLRRAHQLVTAARLSHSRWLDGHDCIDMEVVDAALADAIGHLVRCRDRLAQERALLAHIPGEAP